MTLGRFHADMTGVRVLVTGAAGNLGAAIAGAFHAAGASVVATDLDRAKLAAAMAEAGIAADDPRLLLSPLDLTDLGAADAAVQAALAGFGGLDVLVNNAAAVTPRASIDELSDAAWSQAVAVNLDAPFRLMRAAAGVMRASGKGGVIINVASQLGHVGINGAAAYTATKGALLNLTRTAALDLAPHGIRVVALSPGPLRTSRVTAIYGTPEAAEAALAPMCPIGRLGLCEELAKGALFLASDAAGFVTGSDLLMDGGYTAR